MRICMLEKVLCQKVCVVMFEVHSHMLVQFVWFAFHCNISCFANHIETSCLLLIIKQLKLVFTLSVLSVETSLLVSVFMVLQYRSFQIHSSASIDRWMDVWMGGWMHRWVDGFMDGWMHRWMDT